MDTVSNVGLWGGVEAVARTDFGSKAVGDGRGGWAWGGLSYHGIGDALDGTDVGVRAVNKTDPRWEK